MKYIRTQAGIYEIKDGKFLENFDVEVYSKDFFTKQANTIEELIDKYVLDKIDIILVNKEHTKYRFEGSDEWFDITDTELRKGIYGAIWTNEGLLYVAKMNNKRELELKNE